MLNLLTNAIKFQSKGTILVKAKIEDLSGEFDDLKAVISVID